MADGRYIFRDCVPDGAIDIVNVRTGAIVQRAWSFRVNAPVELQSALDGGTFQPNHIIRGYDGELYDGDGNLLAEVNTFQAQINSTNTDYQAAGNQQVWAIPQPYTVTLTFTETVIKDAKILKKVLDSLAKGAPDASLNFMGVLHAHT